MKYQIINGNNIDVLKTFPDNHFDSIVTDPPYGIDFLGKSWDANTGALETYQECLRVLKPGGHILAFSAARTYHHLAITLEQAGFEIRDQIMWIYSSGFPKSQDIGRSIQRSLGIKETKTKKALNGYAKEQTAHGAQRVGDVTKDDYEKEITSTICTDPEAQKWEGWGTALKPAHEPIALARKPIKLSIAKNCQKYGVGALNIDATRIPMSDEDIEKDRIWKERYSAGNTGAPTFAEDDIDEQRKVLGGKTLDPVTGRFPSNVLGEIPDYQKYFYCPKVSRKERHVGYDLNKVPTIEHNNPDTIHLHPLWTPAIGKNVYRLKEAIEKHNNEVPEPLFGNVQGCYGPDGERFAVGLDKAAKGNNHPTVKPIELMKYLIKLVTPKGGIVLDPFNGSGSTGCAAVELGCEYVGIELDPAYVEIATKRIEAWNKDDSTFKEIFE